LRATHHNEFQNTSLQKLKGIKRRPAAVTKQGVL